MLMLFSCTEYVSYCNWKKRLNQMHNRLTMDRAKWETVKHSLEHGLPLQPTEYEHCSSGYNVLLQSLV